jgi:hypothetical protein
VPPIGSVKGPSPGRALTGETRRFRPSAEQGCYCRRPSILIAAEAICRHRNRCRPDYSLRFIAMLAAEG